MPKIKSDAAIRKQVDEGLVCNAPGCTHPRTMYKGIGEDYCRTHQLALKENGGMARVDRPYTFHKHYCCEWCGFDPKTDSRFDRLTDPKKKASAQSGSLICDHIVARAKAEKLGWTEEQINSKENIQTLCQICEKIKSAEEDDWLQASDDSLKEYR